MEPQGLEIPGGGVTPDPQGCDVEVMEEKLGSGFFLFLG